MFPLPSCSKVKRPTTVSAFRCYATISIFGGLFSLLFFGLGLSQSIHQAASLFCFCDAFLYSPHFYHIAGLILPLLFSGPCFFRAKPTLIAFNFGFHQNLRPISFLFTAQLIQNSHHFLHFLLKISHSS